MEMGKHAHTEAPTILWLILCSTHSKKLPQIAVLYILQIHCTLYSVIQDINYYFFFICFVVYVVLLCNCFFVCLFVFVFWGEGSVYFPLILQINCIHASFLQ
uniref:Uncharacterized protein n=1 Tax=Anguilla anguilla TaxID=7936 RepID=A0A0E9XHD8_ANGAN